MKKSDWMLLAGCLAAAGALALWFHWDAGQPARSVRIECQNRLEAQLSLSEEAQYAVERPGARNVVRIEGETVRMVEASCPDQLCVRQGAIARAGQTIVCLPNQVVVTLTGEEASGEAGLDAVVR